MNGQKITFIGGGNMAQSIVQGLCHANYAAELITISDPDHEKLSAIARQYGVNTDRDNHTAVIDADIIIMAVKPQIMSVVLEPLKGTINPNSVIVSIAAGITLNSLSTWSRSEQAIIRVMPNTPASIQQGMSALIANNYCSSLHKDSVFSIMQCIGASLWLDTESQMDAVTALSGSGPAYFFRMMEIMQTWAKLQGFNEQQASILVQQTALGAAKLALHSENTPGQLRQNVTSPGGTTEAALSTLNQHQIAEIFNQALDAAKHRSETLAQQLAE